MGGGGAIFCGAVVQGGIVIEPISTRTYLFDNRKTGNTVSELTNVLINLNVPIVHNKSIRWKHLGYNGFHLNSYGSSRLAMNLICIIKNSFEELQLP